MKINIETKFELGEIVYLTTDEDQLPRLVVGFTFAGTLRSLIYNLACGAERETQHYEFEISDQKSFR